MKKIACIFSLLTLASCATHESVYWEKKGKVVVVHHVHRTSRGAVDRTERLTTSVMTPAQVLTFDTGRMPDGHGGMREAGKYYRVVQDAQFDTNLPESGKKTNRADNPYHPPNYTPLPESQRINDAVSEANAAKEKLEAATDAIHKKLDEDNALRGELQTQIDENQRLRDQINAGFATPQRSPAPGSTSDASKAAQTATDPLVQFGQKQ